MIKYILFYCVFLLLVGCLGDRPAFYKKGNAIVTPDYICIVASPGDILEYYLLDSSISKDKEPLVYGVDIQKKHPDTCIYISLNESGEYELVYTLSGNNYLVKFSIDSSGNIIKTYGLP